MRIMIMARSKADMKKIFLDKLQQLEERYRESSLFLPTWIILLIYISSTVHDTVADFSLIIVAFLVL